MIITHLFMFIDFLQYNQVSYVWTSCPQLMFQGPPLERLFKFSFMSLFKFCSVVKSE